MRLLVAVVLCAAPAVAGTPDAPAAERADETPRYHDLLALDWTGRADADALLAALSASFQLLIDNRHMRKPLTGAQPPGEPHLIAHCTASLLPDGLVATARHCVRDYPVERAVVLRRFRWAVYGGRLSATGQDDFRVRAERVHERGDLVILRLAETTPAPADAAPYRQPGPRFEFAEGLEFAALGYPNDAHGRPFAGLGCLIAPSSGADGLAGPAAYSGRRCRVEGGMSGGPQFIFRDGGLIQLGVNSNSGGADAPNTVTSPRLEY